VLGTLSVPLAIFLPAPNPALLGVAPVAFALDGLTQTTGLRESTNLLRFATGFFCMLSLFLLLRNCFI
jgi:uncharacterized membrane protein